MHILLFLATIFSLNYSPKCIRIYNDSGADAAIWAFRFFTRRGYKVCGINADEIIDGSWMENTDLLVIPGGRDLPYCAKLNGAGNKKIREFAEGGGNILGICAGAYYCGARVYFDKGGPLEVVGERELKFFPDTVEGPILANYCYGNSSGARAALLEVNDGQGKTYQDAAYYDGGGHFCNAEGYSAQKVSVLATYNPRQVLNGPYTKKLAAIVCIKNPPGEYGNGVIVLSGVHFEYEVDYESGFAITTDVQESLKQNVRGKVVELILRLFDL